MMQREEPAVLAKTNTHSLQVVRWVARLWAVGVVLLVVVMNLAPDPVTGELGGTVTVQQVVLALLFPGIYIAGWLVTWWREIPGGVLMTLSFPLFAGYIALVHGAGRLQPALLVIGLIVVIPGLLFLLTGWLAREAR